MSIPTDVQAALETPANRLGKYVKVSRLGAGGMGEVWKGWDLDLGRWVALKFLHQEDPEELARFRREAQLAGRLSHPNIAGIYEIVTLDSGPFIAMQYVSGSTIAGIGSSQRRRAAEVIRDAARAVQHAHEESVIHRDLKPANIMVDDRGQVFVMDFGLAKSPGSGASLSVSGSVLGTPSYMSPEQARASKSLDHRTDVYSLGATLYHLLTGTPPHTGDTVYDVLQKVVDTEVSMVRSLDSAVPAELETIVMKCLEKETPRRYSTAAELADDLDRWLNGEAIQAHPPSAFYRFRKKLAKRKGVLGAASVGVLASIIVAAIFIPRWLSVSREREDREKARPHLDEGRRHLARLKAFVATSDWKQEEAVELIGRAIGEFDRALEIVPGHPEALLEKARTVLFLGEDERAVELFGEAIRSSPDYSTPYLERAIQNAMRYEQGTHDETLQGRHATAEAAGLLRQVREDLGRVQEIGADPKEVAYARGILQLAEGRYEEAAVLLQAFAKEVRSDFVAWYLAGHAWFHVPGRDEDARLCLTESVRYRPRFYWGQLNLGNLLVRLKRYKEALICLENARVLVPEGKAVRVGLATAYRQLGRRKEALALYDVLVVKHPDDFVTRFNRGNLHRDLKQYAKALDDYENACRLRPEDAMAHVHRGRMLIELGRPKEARAAFESAVELEAENAKAWFYLGKALEALRDEDSALDAYRKAAEFGPDTAAPHTAIGGILFRRGRRSEALESFDEALRRGPDHVAAICSRALIYRGEGKTELAVGECRRAVKLDPKDSFAWYSLGGALFESRKYEEAKAALEKAVQLNPRDKWAWRDLGVAKVFLKDPNGALKDFQQASQIDPRFPEPYLDRARLLTQYGKKREAAMEYEAVLKVMPSSWKLRSRVEKLLRSVRR